MIRNYFIKKSLWLLPFAMFWLAGCTKDLNQSPETQLADDNFWNTTSDLSQACNYLYTFLGSLGGDPSGSPTPYQDNYSDIAYGSGSGGIGDGTRVAPATSNEWTNYYRLIRASNNILEKSVKVSGDAATIARYLGEARFFRAMGYFELVKRFGDVPYISKTLTTVDSLLYSPRTPRQIVIDSIYADLDYAAANCPQPDALAGAEYGRITRSAALAYKSRVALFEGTWDKFRSISTANQNLQAAIGASNTLITEGKHSLYTTNGSESYYYEFQYSGGPTGNPIQLLYGPQINYNYTSNKENILVRLYGQNTSNNIASHSYERGSLEQGNIVPTRAIMDDYLYKDGLPQGKSAYDSSADQTSSLTEFQNRDPRMFASVWTSGQALPQNGGLIPYRAATSYKIRKYFVVSDWNGQTSFINFNIIRYAEVLLNYAEAKYELDGMISDADLDLTINALRNRASGNDVAKLPLLTNAFVAANGLNMRTEIRRERTVELAFEGLHYWDLLRWKSAETVLPNAALGRKYFPAENAGGTTPNLTPDGYVILEAASFRSFDPTRDYLWPLPTKELALSKSLVQNPNW